MTGVSGQKSAPGADEFKGNRLRRDVGLRGLTLLSLGLDGVSDGARDAQPLAAPA